MEKARHGKVSASPSVGVEQRGEKLDWAGQGRVQESIVVFTRRPRRNAAGFVATRDFALEYANFAFSRFSSRVATRKRERVAAFYVIASCVSMTVGSRVNKRSSPVGTQRRTVGKLGARTRDFPRASARRRDENACDVIVSCRFCSASPVASRTMNRYESSLYAKFPRQS